MLSEVKDQTFRNATVDVDGNRFVNCQFFNCVLRYKGGQYGWQGTVFHPDCVWRLDDCALRTARLLSDLRMLKVALTDLDVAPPN